MDQHNPYAAPQIAEFATPIMTDGDWSPAQALGPEWRTVCAGANKCYKALVTLILSVLLMMLFGFVVAAMGSPGLAVLIPIIFFVALIVAWILQLIGQIQLAKVSLASGAKGPLNISLIAFIVASAVGILSSILVGMFVASEVRQVNGPGTRWNMMGMGGQSDVGVVNFIQFAVNLIQYACAILLMVGLRRVGMALRNPSIIKNATIALVIQCTFIGLGIIVMLMALIGGPVSFGRDLGGIMAILGIAILIAALVFLVTYSNALKKIADIAKSPLWTNLP